MYAPYLGQAIPFHGTPITSPDNMVLKAIGKRHYCVSYFRPDQVAIIDAICASWFLDNGEFSAWRSGVEFTPEYRAGYEAFVRTWLYSSCAWHVIPDPIGAGTQLLDAFIREWPEDLKHKAVPVFHTDEPVSRLLRLIESMADVTDRPQVCIGAVGEHQVIGSDAFCRRMDELFNAMVRTFGTVPAVHMFRALQLLKPNWPWTVTSVDSTNLGRNHNRLKKRGADYIPAVIRSVERWDRFAANRPKLWVPPPRQAFLDFAA